MKVFDSLEKQQAELYRWMRKRIDFPFFERLTGLQTTEKMNELEIDTALYEAMVREKAYDAAHDIQHRSKIRAGLLPPALGAALLKYTEKVREATMFEEGLGGRLRSDVDKELQTSLEELCEQMARLR